ncbi:MAG: hypothetical protein GY710_17350 [Desulfobacteraceae bacterium]|nr:hypothetical protein [Desulfobacteraceae bacterium]
MARYTLNRINEKIALWEAADDAVSQGQSYTIGSRQLTRVDAMVIEKKLDSLYAEKDRIEKGCGRMVARQGRVAR